MAEQAVQQLANVLTPLIQAMQAQQNQQHETSIVPLPTFSGNSHEDPINWLDEFERSANANNITDNRKRQIVSAYLRGVAAIWFDQQKALNNNWPVSWDDNDNNFFCRFFCAQFRTNAQVLIWQQQLRLRIQANEESVTQYAEDIRTLL